MSVPFHSVQSGPGVNQRSFVDQVTGTAYAYNKGSSTDGTDEKAVAFAALTAGQTSRITTLIGGGFLKTRPLAEYTLEELKAAQVASLA